MLYLGPMHALVYSHPEVKIDNLVIEYLVRVTWEGSIHYCEIEFPNGEACQVHFSSSGPGTCLTFQETGGRQAHIRGLSRFFFENTLSLCLSQVDS